MKHCKVEVYLLELKLCENNNMDNVVTRHFSKADTIGKTLLIHVISLSGVKQDAPINFFLMTSFLILHHAVVL